jgi:hypothetical protein
MNIIAEEDLRTIITNFQFLFPNETTAEELDILFNTRFDFREAINKNSKDFDLYFYTTATNFKQIQSLIPKIEDNLKRKANIIFKWFPACTISQIKILPN